jgi:16S rRNA (guanine(966)-N(2))-methyltransferase RsmD
MRVIGGTLSGRRFGAPGGRGTRPTSERVREALASALESRDAFRGAHVLDLFAGTGALSFEAMSRGALDAVAIDHDTRALRELKESARSLGLAERTRAIRLDLLGDARTVAAKVPEVAGGFGLVFADAPYSEIEQVPGLLRALVDAGRLAPDAWIVVERPAKHEWAFPNGLASEAEYRYGQTVISLGVHPSEKGK